jgi:hypothetical protein
MYTRVFAVPRSMAMFLEPDDDPKKPRLINRAPCSRRTAPRLPGAANWKRPASPRNPDADHSFPRSDAQRTGIAGHCEPDVDRGREHPVAALDCLCGQDSQIAQDLRRRLGTTLSRVYLPQKELGISMTVRWAFSGPHVAITLYSAWDRNWWKRIFRDGFLMLDKPKFADRQPRGLCV